MMVCTGNTMKATVRPKMTHKGVILLSSASSYFEKKSLKMFR